MSPGTHYVHASAVMVAEAAVLIRGASGAGKSQLVLALLAMGEGRGIFTRLIGDDRVAVEAVSDRLLVSGHPATQGLIEECGTGIISRNIALCGAVRLCVDLVDVAARLPQPGDSSTDIEGIRVPRLAIQWDVGPQEAARRVLAAMNWA